MAGMATASHEVNNLFSHSRPKRRIQRNSPPDGKIIQGDSLKVLKSLEAESVQCCVTSPPYWGLRDYGISGQIGAEMDIKDYFRDLTAIFREVHRVLKSDGILWLNIGDSYTSGGRKWRQTDSKNHARGMDYRPPTPEGLKPKDLIGVPWRLAFALQTDGWFLRNDIVWEKPNNQPESVKDRPTRCHEYVFMFTKSAKYKYHYDAVKIPGSNGKPKALRSVWPINTKPLKEAHFAAFPPSLVETCILASTIEGDSVLDPFFGAGTVGLVCKNLSRSYIGIELKPEYIKIAAKRLNHH